jgi:hypothetical protein
VLFAHVAVLVALVEWSAVLLAGADTVVVLVPVAVRESVTGNPPPFEQAARISSPLVKHRRPKANVRPGLIFTLAESAPCGALVALQRRTGATGSPRFVARNRGNCGDEHARFAQPHARPSEAFGQATTGSR